MSDQPQPVVDVDTAEALDALARIGDAIRAITAAFREVWEHIAATVRAWWPTLRRIAHAMARYNRGPYSSPPPMGIDGRAYTRRRRARARRGAFA